MMDSGREPGCESLAELRRPNQMDPVVYGSNDVQVVQVHIPVDLQVFPPFELSGISG